MINFLTIVNRYEFAQFYRFGYMYVPKTELLQFDNIDSPETKSSLVSRFENKTPFEYDEEYLILNLSNIKERQEASQIFYIDDLKSIYPLSKQAKLSIEQRIDVRIRLEEPVFEPLLKDIVSKIKSKDIEMSIKALWMIFDLEGQTEEISEQLGLENILNGLDSRAKGIKSYQLQSDNIWSILIAYDRYDYYPKTNLGYFFDAGQVFAYSKKRKIENSKLLSALKDIKEESKIGEIINNIQTSENAQSYIQNTKLGSLNYYIVAPLFLMLKDEIRDIDELKKSKYLTKAAITSLKEYGNDFKAALILLGSFFGYKFIYDLYYDNLNLTFFKSYNSNLTIKIEENKLLAGDTQLPSEDNPSVINNIDSEQLEKIEINFHNNFNPENQTDTKNVNIGNLNYETKFIEKTNELKNIDEIQSDVSSKPDFDFEEFVLSLINNSGQILLSELADKLKIIRGDKKKLKVSELQTEIEKFETLEVTGKTSKKFVTKKNNGLFQMLP
jgi:hypothetical protein